MLIERLIMFSEWRAFAWQSIWVRKFLSLNFVYTLNICTHNLAYHTHQGVKINSTFVHAWKLYIQYPRNRVQNSSFSCMRELIDCEISNCSRFSMLLCATRYIIMKMLLTYTQLDKSIYSNLLVLRPSFNSLWESRQ